ncbi:hypothetical protein [Longirhabdus pacifica]|uniref:hypothetical protein n=1 Tax=Longirhabdus pacifica TaxID=2305227 RepID=UPI001009119C|nr:hypothetical protein [Longirhabdus pacifica]
MHKYAMLSLFVIASAMAVVFSITSIEKVEEEVPLAENEVLFVMENFAFDQEVYEIEAGEKVLLLENKSGIHEFSIDGTEVNVTQNEGVNFTFESGQEYTIRCSLTCGTGHLDMVSTIVVL